jgi:hypothetical protein
MPRYPFLSLASYDKVTGKKSRPLTPLQVAQVASCDLKAFLSVIFQQKRQLLLLFSVITKVIRIIY